MTMHRLLAMVGIPVLIGACGFVAPAQADSMHPSRLIAQNAPQPNPPQGQRRPHHRIDFAAAASKLGVPEAHLKAALGVPANPPSATDRQQRPPRPNFKAAAAKLGVTEQRLVEALGIPPRPPGGTRPANQ